MCEAVVVLKQVSRLRRKGGRSRVPIHRVGEIDIEVGNDWFPLHGHVSRRREVVLLDVLQIRHQRLLRRTSRARIPFDRALIDHDCEGEPGMSFRLGHHQLRGVINAVVCPIPVNDHAIDASADHVCNLVVDLPCVIRVVPDAHMIRAAEPEQQMRINLGIRSRIEQRMHVNLADVRRARIAVALIRKALRRAGIVCCLCCQGCRGFDGVCGYAHSCHRQEQEENT